MKKILRLLRDAIKGKEVDLTSGSINVAIVLLAVPMIIEMLGEGLFAIVDAFFVSLVSNEAFATVMLTETVATIIYSLAMGISIAGSAMVSRRIGEKNPKAAAEAASQTILFAFGLSMIISIAGIYFAKDILLFMGADDAVLKVGVSYTQILLGSNIVIFLLFILNGIFRGAGNAAIAMRSLWIANIINIILDPILIFGVGPIPAMGVMGAAIATTIGRSVGVFYQLYILFNGKSIIQLAKVSFAANWLIIKKIANVASTGAGQYLISSASWIFLMRLVAEFGTDAVNGYGLGIRIIIFTILPAWGIANAGATLMGQNLGAKQFERAGTSVWRAAYLNAMFLFVVSILYFIFAEKLIGLFNSDAEVIAIGTRVLKIFSLSYIFFGFAMVLSQAFGGAGDTRTPTIINFVCFWLIQIPLAYFLTKSLSWGLDGVLWAVVISETIMTLVFVVAFRRGTWKTTEI
jgi:putative MATE family efflux protein